MINSCNSLGTCIFEQSAKNFFRVCFFSEKNPKEVLFSETVLAIFKKLRGRGAKIASVSFAFCDFSFL